MFRDHGKTESMEFPLFGDIEASLERYKETIFDTLNSVY